MGKIVYQDITSDEVKRRMTDEERDIDEKKEILVRQFVEGMNGLGYTSMVILAHLPKYSQNAAALLGDDSEWALMIDSILHERPEILKLMTAISILRSMGIDPQNGMRRG